MGLKKPAVGGKRVAYGEAKPYNPPGKSSRIEVRGLSFKPNVVVVKPKSYVDAGYPKAVGGVYARKEAFNPNTTYETNIGIDYDETSWIMPFDIYDDGFDYGASTNATWCWVAYE
ncbi:TPA: hypothetical protein ACGW5C_005593 [Bacillus cereus]